MKLRFDRTGSACRMLLLPLLMLTGCALTRPTVNVPVQSTAEEQYQFAQRYHRNRQIGVITDAKKYRMEREIVIATYDKVAEYFPEDRQATPLARLDAIKMRIGFDLALETDRAFGSRRAHTAALREGIGLLNDLISDYPENERIQAEGLFLKGWCYMHLNEYRKATEIFREVRDEFRGSESEQIRSVATLAQVYYNQVYVE